MGDDYEILDPNKTMAKPDDGGPPSTPMLSSLKKPVLKVVSKNKTSKSEK